MTTQFIPMRGRVPDFGMSSDGRSVAVLDPGGQPMAVVTSQVNPLTGVGRNSLGELIWSHGKNQLVRTQPDRLVGGALQTGAQGWTSTSLISGATAALDAEMTCPLSGLPTVHCQMPAGATGLQRINWQSLPNVECRADDIWTVTVWLSSVPTYLELYLVPNPTGSWSNAHRYHRWRGEMLRVGWNVLHARHVENRLGAAEYGVVGTSWDDGGVGTHNIWVNMNGMTADDTIGQIRLGWSGVESASVRIGSVYKAARGWATGVVCWSADDVPRSFLDLAIPVIEGYGWRTTLNITTTLTAGSPVHISMSDLADLMRRGHEVWGHTATHVNLATADEATRNRELRESSKFFRNRGIDSAARCLVWPYLEESAAAAAAAKAAGYIMARGYRGRMMSPLAPLVEPYNLPAVSTEVENSWRIDTAINRAAELGLMTILYMHNAVPGGAASNTYPGSTSFYVDHLRRWCDRVAAHERAGTLAVLTATESFRAAGIDPYTAAMP